MISSLLLTLIILLISQILFFLLSSKLKNIAVADIGWGAGFVFTAIGQMVFHWPTSVIQTVTVLLVLLWGMRLILHLLPRIRSGREDWRYAEMRKRWGRSAGWKSFTHVFLLQGLLLGLITLPILSIFTNGSSRISILDYIGTGFFLFGLIFESIADRQLVRFIKTEKSEIRRFMTGGLWRFSRHPNYFGEAVVWWGIYLIAFSGPKELYLILSPALITFLLIKVSGVPLLEKRYANDPQFQVYKAKTSIFIPWFPKRTF